MYRPCVVLVAVLYLIGCSGSAVAPEGDHIKIDLRIGGGFTQIERGWITQVADELARTIPQIPPTPVAQIPDLGPFHEERLAEEGIVELVGVRVFVERLGEHHPQWELGCLGRSRQVYRRSQDDPRTAIGVVFLARELIALDEQLFKAIYRYHLDKVISVGLVKVCQCEWELVDSMIARE